MKKVSILITSYNYDKYVGKCIQSCIDQDYPLKEIIIIDDTSSDNSRNIIQEFKEKNPELIIIMHDSNFGIKKTLLEGLEMATGDYICRIDSDDYLIGTQSISLKVSLFEKHPDIAFVYSNFITIDSIGNKIPNAFSVDHESDFVGNDFINIISGNKIISSGTLINMKYKKEIAENIWDWDLWLHLSKNYEIGYISKPLVYYRVHDQSYLRTAHKKNDDFEAKNHGKLQKDYMITHGFDVIRTVLKDMPSHQKITFFDKNRALATCYRFGAHALLKRKRYTMFVYYLMMSILLNPSYFFKNFKKIAYLSFNLEKF